MRALRTLLVVMATVATASLPAVAGTTLITRVDARKGATPYYVEGVVLQSGWELWGFGLDPHWRSVPSDMEVGRLAMVPGSAGHVLAGGYGVLWPDHDRLFAEPYVVVDGRALRAYFHLDVGGYLPANGGPLVLYSNGASAAWPIGRQTEVGLVASFWRQGGGPTPVDFGPIVRTRIANVGLEFRYQPAALSPSGQGMEDGFRVQVTRAF